MNYLPDSAAPDSTLPTHLQLVPAEVSETRAKSGFSHRTLVGIGHSFGGGSLYEVQRSPPCRRGTYFVLSRALAVINNPTMFSSLVLVDPVVLPPPPPGKFESWVEALRDFSSIMGFVDGALTRRSTWKSRFVAHLSSLLLSDYSMASSEPMRWKCSKRTLCSRHGIRSRSRFTWTARSMKTGILEKQS